MDRGRPVVGAGASVAAVSWELPSAEPSRQASVPSARSRARNPSCPALVGGDHLSDSEATAHLRQIQRLGAGRVLARKVTSGPAQAVVIAARYISRSLAACLKPGGWALHLRGDLVELGHLPDLR